MDSRHLFARIRMLLTRSGLGLNAAHQLDDLKVPKRAKSDTEHGTKVARDWELSAVSYCPQEMLSMDHGVWIFAADCRCGFQVFSFES